ncbi:hypothetical protein EYR26_12125 [Xanthomonas oryzae]|nr:hypothetical protein EYR26_12125 [Xanthomonas oryzae]
MPPHSEQIVSRICGVLFRGSLADGVGYARSVRVVGTSRYAPVQMPVGAIRMHVNGRPPAAWDRALEQRIAWRSTPPPEWHESHAICLTALGNAAGTAFAAPCGLSSHRQSPDRDRQQVEIGFAQVCLVRRRSLHRTCLLIIIKVYQASLMMICRLSVPTRRQIFF